MRRSLMKTSLMFLLLQVLSYADFIGGEISVGVFNHSPEGYARYDLFGSGTDISVKDDLGWESSQNPVMKGYIEHPLPLIPNLKVGYTNLSNKGSASVTSFQWGEIIGFDGNINNKMDLQLSDITLYYELLDNWVTVDTGFTLRNMKGDITVTTDTAFMAQTETVNFDTWFPLVYLKGRFDFPVTDLSVQLEANAIGYEDVTFYDAEVSIRYTVLMGLGIEAGYKTMHLENKELASDLTIDLDFSGPYAAVVWDF